MVPFPIRSPPFVLPQPRKPFTTEVTVVFSWWVASVRSGRLPFPAGLRSPSTDNNGDGVAGGMRSEHHRIGWFDVWYFPFHPQNPVLPPPPLQSPWFPTTIEEHFFIATTDRYDLNRQQQLESAAMQQRVWFNDAPLKCAFRGIWFYNPPTIPHHSWIWMRASTGWTWLPADILASSCSTITGEGKFFRFCMAPRCDAGLLLSDRWSRNHILMV